MMYHKFLEKIKGTTQHVYVNWNIKYVLIYLILNAIYYTLLDIDL